jgi:hypothetical protein
MVCGDFGAATVCPQFAAITTMHAASSIGCVQHGARRLRGTLTPQSRRSLLRARLPFSLVITLPDGPASRPIQVTSILAYAGIAGWMIELSGALLGEGMRGLSGASEERAFGPPHELPPVWPDCIDQHIDSPGFSSGLFH